MRQLGNLAIVCAQRPDVLMRIHGREVSVFAGDGPDRTVLHTAWDNDTEISRIIHELNFGNCAVELADREVG